MDEVQKEETIGNDLDVKYAGFWIRFCAYLVDGIIVIIIGYFVGIVLGVFFATAGLYNVLAPLAGILGLLVRWGYYVYMTYDHGATLGKKLFGLRVISTSNEQIDLGQVFLRETIGKVLSALILGIGFLMIGFGKEKEGLHDKIGKTRVIYANSVGPERWRLFLGGVIITMIVAVFSSFVFYLMAFSASNISKYKIKSFYAQTALLQVREDIKKCNTGGGSIVQPENQNGGGPLCSNDLTMTWVVLENGFNYGIISDESVEIVLDSGEIFGCMIDDDNCGFVK